MCSQSRNAFQSSRGSLITYLQITITFHDLALHGRGDGGLAEWPPSPLRLDQAIIAANAAPTGSIEHLAPALRWLESLPPPTILAPISQPGDPYRLSVPDNQLDLVTKAWSKGVYDGKDDANPATHRSMKTVRPTHLTGGDQITYVWQLPDPLTDADRHHADSIRSAIRSIIALGWGIDLVVAHGQITDTQPAQEHIERWSPSPQLTETNLRTPRPGTLDALIRRHHAFQNRVIDDLFIPPPPLTTFDTNAYRRPTDPILRPSALIALRGTTGEFHIHPHAKLIHLAGMLRHKALEVMKNFRDPAWLESVIAGHRPQHLDNHKQFSYIPLPTIGHPQADALIRRVMILAPVGEEAALHHLANQLDGTQLQPEDPKAPRPLLERIQSDNVTKQYLALSTDWHSVTPVILPGHDDHKPAKTHKLILAALRHSGIEQPCCFTWSPVPNFKHTLSACSHNRKGQHTGYFRPNHLENKSAVHLQLHFNEKIPGPPLHRRRPPLRPRPPRNPHKITPFRPKTPPKQYKTLPKRYEITPKQHKRSPKRTLFSGPL